VIPEDSPPVETEALGHRYGERTALEAVTLRVEAGEAFALLGPNGGGKTTLFKVLSTLMAPSEGGARVFGYDTVSEAHEVRRRLGVVFQSPSLDGKLSVEENLRYQGHLYGLWGPALEERAARSLEVCQLEERRRDLVETLSGGLQRRVELAKVLLHDPDLVLLDEPTTGLDPGARREFWAWVAELQRARGATLLFTTHLMEEANRADRVCLLDQGQVVALDRPENLCAELGGDVLVLKAREPARLLEELAEAWEVEGRVTGDELRLEVADGTKLTGLIYERFGERIGSITLGRPTLEDVFLHRTGHDLRQGARR